MNVINGIEYKFYIDKLFVRQLDGFPNAVARVDWACVMKRNGAKVIGAGRTDLPAPVGDGFIDIANLEAQQVIDWVIAKEGGDVWLNGLLSVHDAMLTEQESFAGLEHWGIPLINPLRFDPDNV